MASIFTSDPVELTGHIGFLKLKLGESFNTKCVISILRLRKDLPTKIKKNMIKLFEEKKDEIEVKRKKNLEQYLFTTIKTQLRVNEFLVKIRDKIQIKKDLLKYDQKRSRNSTF